MGLWFSIRENQNPEYDSYSFLFGKQKNNVVISSTHLKVYGW